MLDPKKKRYFYYMFVGFGAIGLSIILYFMLNNVKNINSGLKKFNEVMAPFIYGGVVAYLVRPMCNTFEDFLNTHLPKKLKKFSSTFAIMGSLFVLVLILYTLLNMIIPKVAESVINLWNMIPGRVATFLAWAEKTFGEDEALLQLFNTSYERLYAELSGWAESKLIPQLSSFVSGVGLQVSTIVSGVGSSVYKLMKVLYNFLIGLIVAVYLLSSRKQFARQGVLIVRSALPEKWANLFLSEIAFVDKMFGGFIDAKILDSAIVGLLCYIGATILRLPNALLVSVFVGVTNVIPFFGPFIGAVPSTLLILIEDPIKALWFVVFILILQQVDGNVIGPRLMGNRTGLSSFWVLFAIVLFGGIWGIFGMIICVPVFAVFYDTVKKLVRRGLRQKGRYELWEQYIADYPNNDLPK